MMFKQQLSVWQVASLGVLLLVQIASPASSRRVGFDGQGDDSYDDVSPLEDSSILSLDENDESSSDHTSQLEEYLDDLESSSSWNQMDIPKGWMADNDTTISAYNMEEFKPKPKLVECGSYKPASSRKRIAGGYVAEKSEFPSFVQVVAYLRGSCSSSCGGTIISETEVLTAAHCFDPLKLSPLIYVEILAGSIVINSGQPLVSVKTCKPKDYMSQSLTGSDIAILTMREPFKWSESIQPACLPKTYVDPTRQSYFVGFGYTSMFQTDPEHLQVLPVIKSACDHKVQEDRVCFQSNDPEFVGLTCDGDSGGPVYATIDGKQTVVAVLVSGKPHCTKGLNPPSTYMDVFRSMNMINQLSEECHNYHPAPKRLSKH